MLCSSKPIRLQILFQGRDDCRKFNQSFLLATNVSISPVLFFLKSLITTTILYRIVLAHLHHGKQLKKVSDLFKIKYKDTRTTSINKVWNLFKINNSDNRTSSIDVVLVFHLFTLNRLTHFFWCFHCWLWLSKCR